MARIEVDAKELAGALKLAAEFWPSKTTLPILAGARFSLTFKPGAGLRLEVLTTDLEKWGAFSVPVLASDAGADGMAGDVGALFVLGLKHFRASLAAVLKSAGKGAGKGARVSLDWAPGGAVNVRLLVAGGGGFVAPGMASEDFPMVNGFDRGTFQGAPEPAEVPAAAVADVLRRVVPFVSDDCTRPALGAVCFEPARRELCATDGHRLMALDLGYGMAGILPLPAAGSALVAADACSALVAVLSAAAKGAGEFQTGARFKWEYSTRTDAKTGAQSVGHASGLVVSGAGFRCVFRLLQGPFPNYEQVIPKGGRDSVEFLADAGALGAGFASVLPAADKVSAQVRVKIGRAGLVLMAGSDESGTAAADIPILGWSGGPDDEALGKLGNVAGYNGAYWADAAAALAGSEMVRVQYSGPVSVMVMRAEFMAPLTAARVAPGAGYMVDAVSLLMPLRLDDAMAAAVDAAEWARRAPAVEAEPGADVAADVTAPAEPEPVQMAPAGGIGVRREVAEPGAEPEPARVGSPDGLGVQAVAAEPEPGEVAAEPAGAPEPEPCEACEMAGDHALGCLLDPSQSPDDYLDRDSVNGIIADRYKPEPAAGADAGAGAPAEYWLRRGPVGWCVYVAGRDGEPLTGAFTSWTDADKAARNYLGAGAVEVAGPVEDSARALSAPGGPGWEHGPAPEVILGPDAPGLAVVQGAEPWPPAEPEPGAGADAGAPGAQLAADTGAGAEPGKPEPFPAGWHALPGLNAVWFPGAAPAAEPGAVLLSVLRPLVELVRPSGADLLAACEYLFSEYDRAPVAGGGLRPGIRLTVGAGPAAGAGGA